MTLKVLSSGSHGNCYLLISNNDTLIIEAGVKLAKVKQALGFDMSMVKGLICSHPSHGDHGAYILEYLSAGINCYAGALEWNAVNIFHHRAYPIHNNQLLKLGSFSIIPFEVQHDSAEPYGFLIKHSEMGTTLFLTDSYYTKHRFTGLNNIIVECNFSHDIINAKAANDLQPWRKNRLLSSHMSLQTLKDMLQANDLSQVNSITLIHLSNTNSNAEQFKIEIQALTGIPVTIAETGLTLENYGAGVPF